MGILSFTHECGCVLARQGNTSLFELIESCDAHGGPLSWEARMRASVTAPRAAAQQPAAPRPTIEIWNPIDGEQASHTLCDEQIDFLNLTLTRERFELLQERRTIVLARRKDPTSWTNRITEIDAETSMIDSITLKLRRQT